MTTSRGTILIVDDDPKLRQALNRTLSALGFEIVESSSGEQAVRQIQKQRFDTVLLDVNMPGMGGTTRAVNFDDWPHGFRS